MSARCSLLIAAIWLVALIAQPSLSLADSVVVFGGPCNIPIKDPVGPGGELTEAPLNISPGLTIGDLDVRISITHTKVFDLQLYLQSPAGTRTLLNMYNWNEFFLGANYTQTVFDDEASVPIEQAQAPFTGGFRPKSPFVLSDFDGESTAGQWLLQIYDMYPADTGTLDSFELIVTTPEPSTAALLIFAGVLSRQRARRRKSRWVPPTRP